MFRHQNLSLSSSQLVCVEDNWDDRERKVAAVWGDPADVGVEKINHASHPHPLYQFKLEIEDETKCRICSKAICGFAHGCEACDFFIHDDECLKLEVQIRHKSHPAHPLFLFPPPYGHNICDACCSPANTPFYRCSICDYDLHIDCASSLYEGQRKLDDGNLIRLYYSFPVGASLWCSKCYGGISRRGWVWYDKDTDYTAHFVCGRPELIRDRPCFLDQFKKFLIKRRLKRRK